MRFFNCAKKIKKVKKIFDKVEGFFRVCGVECSQKDKERG